MSHHHDHPHPQRHPPQPDEEDTSPPEFRRLEAAVRELVEAKIQNLPLPQEEPVRKGAKVINLMDALRKSVQGDKAAGEEKKPVQKAAASSRQGMALVKAGRGSKRNSA